MDMVCLLYYAVRTIKEIGVSVATYLAHISEYSLSRLSVFSNTLFRALTFIEVSKHLPLLGNIVTTEYV